MCGFVGEALTLRTLSSARIGERFPAEDLVDNVTATPAPATRRHHSAVRDA
jgi:hypothetical protein